MPSSPTAPIRWWCSQLLPKIYKVRRSCPVGHWDRLLILAGGPHVRPPLPAKFTKICKIRRPPSVVLFQLFMRFPFPIQSGGLPYTGAISYACGISPYVFAASPCNSAASHTQAVSPYGIAVFPYGHTPDAFPHTFWQIPIGRPFSHSHGRSPIARPSPHTIHIIDKAAGFHFDETSGSSSTNPQPTPTSKHQGPALHLCKPSAGQFQQMLQTCDWGGVPSPPARTVMRTLSWARARPWSYLHGYVHGHGHARTVTHMHGHGHTFTGMCTATSTSGHASDETSVRLTQIKLQPSSLKCPAAA